MGAERIIESLTKGQQELGHEVFLQIHPDSKDMPARVVIEPPWGCDILHFHQWEPDKIDYGAYGIPWVVTIHGGGSESDPEWLRATKEHKDNVICISDFVSKRTGAPAFVWNPSDPADFMYSEIKEDYFLWMAGTDWGEAKGLWTTIEWAKRLRFNLHIAGGGQNKSTIEKIKSLCDDKIQYVGVIEGQEKAKTLRDAKALFHLVKIPDACPTTISEAMLSGTPVICSAQGAMPEIVRDGKTGFVCRLRIDVAKAILNVRNLNPYDCYQYGLEHFSHTSAAKKYLRYYNNMLEFGSILGG